MDEAKDSDGAPISEWSFEWGQEDFVDVDSQWLSSPTESTSEPDTSAGSSDGPVSGHDTERLRNGTATDPQRFVVHSIIGTEAPNVELKEDEDEDD